MRHVLGDTLRRLGLREDSVSDLLVAVTEACTNVLQHSGPGRGYEVVAIVGKNRCVLEVVDNGRGFDPVWLPARRAAKRSVSRLRHRYTRVAPPSAAGPSAPAGLAGARGPLSRVRRGAQQRAVSRLPESGRGLAVMRAFVDDVTLQSRPGRGTIVWLAKEIELRRDAPLASPEVLTLRDAG